MHAENRFEAVEKYGRRVVAAAILVVLWFAGRSNYVILHTFVEMFAVIVACAIFTLAWNCRGPD